MSYQIHVVDDIPLFKCILTLKQYCKDNSLETEFVRTLRTPKSLIINCSLLVTKALEELEWITEIKEYHPLYLKVVVD